MKNKNPNSNNASNIVPHKPRKKKQRDLSCAITLRPAEVFALYGIPSSTLCQLCKHQEPEKRLPSHLIPGRRGRKGLRLIDHAELRAYLKRWRGDEEGGAVAA
jgi:hypothetical protein